MRTSICIAGALLLTATPAFGQGIGKVDSEINRKLGAPIDASAFGNGKVLTVSGGRIVWATASGGSGSYSALGTVRVDKGGNDSTGTPGDSTKPYLTIAAALAAASDGDVIHLGVGAYFEDLTIPADRSQVTIVGDFRESTVIFGNVAWTPTGSGMQELTFKHLSITGTITHDGSGNAGQTFTFADDVWAHAYVGTSGTLHVDRCRLYQDALSDPIGDTGTFWQVTLNGATVFAHDSDLGAFEGPATLNGASYFSAVNCTIDGYPGAFTQNDTSGVFFRDCLFYCDVKLNAPSQYTLYLASARGCSFFGDVSVATAATYAFDARDCKFTASIGGSGSGTILTGYEIDQEGGALTSTDGTTLRVGGTFLSSDSAPGAALLAAQSAYSQASSNKVGPNAYVEGGISAKKFTIVSYTLLHAADPKNVFQLNVDEATTVLLTVDTDFNAVTSNGQTATNLATALNGSSVSAKVTATAVGADVFVQPKGSCRALYVAVDAAGSKATATNNTNSVVYLGPSVSCPGFFDSTREATNSEHFGYGSVASSYGTTATGYTATANGSHATAYGSGSLASADGAAFGQGAYAGGTGNTALGDGTQCNLNYSIALAFKSQCNANNELVCGSDFAPILDLYFGRGESSTTSPETVTWRGTSSSSSSGHNGGSLAIIPGAGDNAGLRGTITLGGQTVFKTGQGAISFLVGPSDQDFIIQAGSGKDMKLQDSSGNYIRIEHAVGAMNIPTDNAYLRFGNQIGIGRVNNDILAVCDPASLSSPTDLRVINTTDTIKSPTDSEYGGLFWKTASNVFHVGTAKTGAGTVRSLALSTGGIAALTINSSQAATFANTVAAQGETLTDNTAANTTLLTLSKDPSGSQSGAGISVTMGAHTSGDAIYAACDSGASGYMLRTHFNGGVDTFTVSTGGNVTAYGNVGSSTGYFAAAAGGGFYLSARGGFESPADGQYSLRNQAGDHILTFYSTAQTGAGTLAPTWTNFPGANTGTQNPWGYIKVKLDDGTTAYIPAFK